MCYPLDGNLPNTYSYLPFKQPEPGVLIFQEGNTMKGFVSLAEIWWTLIA